MKYTFFKRAWSSPKQGNTSAENEDAWRTICAQDADASTLLLVVADGATEGVFSRTWAQTLVNAVTPDWLRLSDAELTGQLQQLRKSYQPLPPGQEMAWNVKTKLMTEGSCATLLAATVTATADGVQLEALAIGDCCLLVLREDGSLAYSFPLAMAADFNTSPALVRSLYQPQLEYRRLAPVRLEVGDILVLCTDAIGKWALECVEMQSTHLLTTALSNLLAAEMTASSTTPAPPLEASAPVPSHPDLTRNHTHQAEQLVIAKTEPPAHPLRIIPRWLVPDFVRAWFPPQAPPAVRPGPESPLAEPPPGPPPSVETSALPVAPSTSPLTFAQWVTRAQAEDSQPRMKNDDTTLIVCVPLRAAEESPMQALQARLRRQEREKER